MRGMRMSVNSLRFASSMSDLWIVEQFSPHAISLQRSCSHHLRTGGTGAFDVLRLDNTHNPNGASCAIIVNPPALFVHLCLQRKTSGENIINTEYYEIYVVVRIPRCVDYFHVGLSGEL